MTPDTPFRVGELERRVGHLEDRMDSMKFDAVLVRVDEAREDIKELNMRFVRLTWLLVTTLASTSAGIVIAVLTLSGGH